MSQYSLSLYHITRPAKDSTKKAPVIIMLHGFGSDENDLFSFAEELPDDYFIISAKAPFPMQPYGNAWYAIYLDGNNAKHIDKEQAISSRNKIVNFIDEVIANYPVDPNNVTLLGFSQGTILSLATALSYPNKVKNVIALSGYIDESLLTEGYKDNDFLNLNIYSSHGSVDQVIPVEWARKTKPFLDNLKIENCYSEYPVGHGVAPQNFYSLKKWLEENR